MAFIKSENINKVTQLPKARITTIKPSPADNKTRLVNKSVPTTNTTFSTKSYSKSFAPTKQFSKSEKIRKTPTTPSNTPISRVSGSSSQKIIKNPATPSPATIISNTLISNKTTKSSIKPVVKSAEPSTTKTEISIPSSTNEKSSKKNVKLPIKSTSSSLKATSLKISSPLKSSSKPTASKLLTSPKSSPRPTTLSRDIRPSTKEKTRLPLTKEMKSTVIPKSNSKQTSAKSAANSLLQPVQLPQTVVSKNVSKTAINLDLDISETQETIAQNLEIVTLQPDKAELCRCIEPQYLDIPFDDFESPDPNFNLVQAYKLAEKLIRFQEYENLTMNWPLDPSFESNDEIPSLSNQKETSLRSTCIKSKNSDEIWENSNDTEPVETENICDIPVTGDATKLTNSKSTEIADSIELVANSTSDSINAKGIGEENISSPKFSLNKCKSLCITYAQEREIKNHIEYKTTIQELSQKSFSPLQITAVECQSVCLTNVDILKYTPEVTNATNLTPKQPLTPLVNLQQEYQMLNKVGNLYTTNIFFPKIDNNVDRPGTICDNNSDEIEHALVRKKPYKKFKSFSKRYLRNIRKDFINQNFEDAYDYTNIFIAPVSKNI